MKVKAHEIHDFILDYFFFRQDTLHDVDGQVLEHTLQAIVPLQGCLKEHPDDEVSMHRVYDCFDMSLEVLRTCKYDVNLLTR